MPPVNKNLLLDAITRIQSIYIQEADSKDVFDLILKTALDLSGSEYGFVGEVFFRDGAPYLKTRAITDISWDDDTRRFYQENAPTGMEFANLETLFGAALKSGQIVLSNDPANDPRSGGLPQGHPPLTSFLGAPVGFGDRMVGMLGLANRPGGYDEELVEYLGPLLQNSANIIQSIRNKEMWREAELGLVRSEERLQLAMRASNDGLWDWDIPTGKAYFSPNYFAMLGYEDGELESSFEVFDRLLHPDDREWIGPLLDKAIKNREEGWEFEMRMRSKMGPYRWIYSRGKIIEWDDEGAPIRAIGTHVDITERKAWEEKLLASEGRYRSVIDNAPAVIYSLDREGIFTTSVGKGLERLGLAQNEVVGLSVFDLYRDQPAIIESMKEALAGKERHLVIPLQNRYWESWMSPLFDEEGQPNGLSCISLDVTERVVATDKSTQLGNVIETSLNEVFLFDAETLKFILVNQGARMNLGYSMEELERMTPLDIKPLISDEAFAELVQPLKSQKVDRVNFITKHRRKDGSDYDVEVHLQMDRFDGRSVFVAMILDVTDRVEAENELKLSEARNRALIESIPDILFRQNREGVYLDFYAPNPELLAVPPEEIIGKNIRDVGFEPQLLKRFQSSIEVALDSGVVTVFEYGLEVAAGRRSFEARILPSGAEEILCIIRDITDQKATERALKRSNDVLEAVSAIAEMFIGEFEWPDCLNEAAMRLAFALEVQRAYVFENRVVDGRTLSDLRGMWTGDTFQPGDREPQREGVDLEATGFQRWISLLGGGDALVGDVEDFPESEKSRMLGVVPDLASVIVLPIFVEKKWWGFMGFDACGEKRAWSEAESDALRIAANIIGAAIQHMQAEAKQTQLESQFQQAQKLESLGILAGGIAHDFNNILMVILGNADLARSDLSSMHPAYDSVKEIETAARRAADLTRQMLAYSGKGRFLVEPISVNDLVEEMTNMLEVSISKKAILRYELYADLPAVMADATQLRQIILNLIINASEAIGDKSGVILVATGALYCDRQYLETTFLVEDLEPGLYVYVEVSDTGCGMSPDVQEKLFDPFFTTKFTGRGLGMAAVQGIVRGHKGAVKIYSELKKGSNFKVLIPAIDQAAMTRSEAPPDPEAWKGEGTVLLVDDEETVCSLGRRMLERLGFDTLIANDGREGLEVFKAHRDRIVCVLLDLTMPHMDGETCFRELRILQPDVKVILSSGYNEQEVTNRFAGKGLAGFVQKPYQLESLRAELKKTLP